MKEQIKNIHNKAISLYKDKKFSEAIQLWQKALEVEPQEIQVLYSLGIINFELKKYDDAINFLQKLLDLSPGHHKAMLILGTAYIKLRKFQQAEEFIKKSVEINPKQKLAYLNLGAIYSVLKRFDEGIEMFNKVIETHPKEVRAHLGLAKIYSILGQNKDAVSYFKKVIELNPNGRLGIYAKKALMLNEFSSKDDKDLENIYKTGYKYLLSGFYNDAIAKFETYLLSKPKDDLANFLLAQSQLRKGLTKESFLSFKKAIINNPKNGLYYKELAILLDKIGNPNDVIEIISKANEFGKVDSITYYLLGKNLFHLNRLEEAENNLKKSIKIDRNNLNARLTLAQIYKRNNENELAENQIQFILNFPKESLLKEKAVNLSTQ